METNNIEIALDEHYLNCIHQYPKDTVYWTIAYINCKRSLMLLKKSKEVKQDA